MFGECGDEAMKKKYIQLQKDFATTSAFVKKQCKEMKDDLQWMVPMERVKDVRLKNAIGQVRIEEWMMEDSEVESDWEDNFTQMKEEMELCVHRESPKLRVIF